MSGIITEVGSMDQAKGILNNPHHPYWDAAPTRREVMALVSALANNDKEFSERSDTVYLVVNLLAERLNVTRGEIDAYVAAKAAEVNAWKEKMLNTEGQPQDAQPTV